MPTAESSVRQGVTTLIEGPDGSSPVPLGPFLGRLEALPKSVNIGSFIGQGSIREAVLGAPTGLPPARSSRRCDSSSRQGMRDGAFGLSSGLFYVPGAFATTEEVVALARVAGTGGGIYQSHMRNEAAGILDSVRETIAIGEQGGLPTQITHHKIIGKSNWGKSVETLRLVDEARARGIDATIDQYPYTASSTSIGAALLPAWAQEGGRGAAPRADGGPGGPDPHPEGDRAAHPGRAGRRRPEERRSRRVRVGPLARRQEPGRRDGGAGPPARRRERGEDRPLDRRAGRLLRHLPRDRRGGPERILKHPATMVASDGGLPIFGEAMPHPRSYGTFARVLGVYVRETPGADALGGGAENVVASRRAPGPRRPRPAAARDEGRHRGLRSRSRARHGDVREAASVRRGRFPVVVNGRIVFERGAMTAARPGRVLYGAGRAAR